MNIADTTISLTQVVGNAARLATKIGGPTLPIIEFIGGFVPGLAPAIKVLEIAEPILEKIAAGAPIVANGIEAGRPVFDAISKASPDLLQAFKELYALAQNHDPAVPVTNMTADDVSDEVAESFAAHIVGVDPEGWTHKETQLWWDRDKGDR